MISAVARSGLIDDRFWLRAENFPFALAGGIIQDFDRRLVMADNRGGRDAIAGNAEAGPSMQSVTSTGQPMDKPSAQPVSVPLEELWPP